MQEAISKAQNQHDQYVCVICYELSENAVQSHCCHKTYCEKCAFRIKKKKALCPFCRKQGFDYDISKYREEINKIEVPCNLCKNTFVFHDLNEHVRDCDMNKVQCRICKVISIKKDIQKHTYEDHIQQIPIIVKQYQLKGSGSVSFREFQNGLTKNQKGREVHLGTSGKVYCGGQLQGNCHCCNGYCGPTNGQNCYSCMKLDKERKGLPHGYLINADGIVAWRKDNLSSNFYCGVILGYSYQQGQSEFCSQNNQCYRCRNLTSSAPIRYKGLY